MLRAIYNFEHCVKTASPALDAAFPDILAGLGYQGVTFTNPAKIAVDSNGFLGAYSNTNYINVAFSMAGIVPPASTKVTIGFRAKALQVYASSHSLMGIGYPGAENITDATAYMWTVVPANDVWTQTANKEAYIEATVDLSTGAVTIRVDGSPQTTVLAGTALTTAQRAAIAAGNWTICFFLRSAVAARYAIRDIYLLDVVAGDGFVAPIGPQKMFPIALDAADGAGWTPSGTSNVLDTLNAPLPASAYVTSASDKTPLITSLKTTAPAGSRVNAVSLSLSGTSLGDAPSVSKIELTQGGTTLAPKFVPVQRAVTYGASVGLYTKAPDGALWDLSKIDATTLKLTPDTAA